MLGEVSIFGALVPYLLVVFLLALAVFLPVDWLAMRTCVYDLTWHPALARFSLFLCLFSGLALAN